MLLQQCCSEKSHQIHINESYKFLDVVLEVLKKISVSNLRTLHNIMQLKHWKFTYMVGKYVFKIKLCTLLEFAFVILYYY